MKTLLAIVLIAMVSNASATWRLTKGTAYSRTSQADATNKACQMAENQCLQVYQGDLNSGCFTRSEGLQVIPGYGGAIWIWTATEVVGCIY